MTDTPLTDQQLDDIEARAGAATPGPWERYEEYGPTFFANTAGEYLRGVGDFNFGVGKQADADEAFVRHAQQDVPALLAEVRRQRAELAAMHTKVLAVEADEIVAHCPDHGSKDGVWMDCHCAVADDMCRRAAAASAVAVAGGEQ